MFKSKFVLYTVFVVIWIVIGVVFMCFGRFVSGLVCFAMSRTYVLEGNLKIIREEIRIPKKEN